MPHSEALSPRTRRNSDGDAIAAARHAADHNVVHVSPKSTAYAGLDALTEERSRRAIHDRMSGSHATRIWQATSAFLLCVVLVLAYNSGTENILLSSLGHGKVATSCASPAATASPEVSHVERSGDATLAPSATAAAPSDALVFGTNSNKGGACRHYCTRLALHEHTIAFQEGRKPRESARTFAELRAALVDNTPWMCDDLQATLNDVAKHGCDCRDADAWIPEDVPGAMTYGSVQLWEFLREFSWRQRYMLQWLHNIYALGSTAAPPPPPERSPFGCEMGMPTEPRLVAYRCSGPGGAADQLKGLITAFMATLLHPKPHAFVADCRGVMRLDEALFPHNSSVSIDWRFPAWLKPVLGVEDGPTLLRADELDSYSWPDHPGQFTGIERFFSASTDSRIKVLTSNAYVGRTLHMPHIHVWLESKYRSVGTGACSLPPELWYAVTGMFVERAPAMHALLPSFREPFLPSDPSLAQHHGSAGVLLERAGCPARSLHLPGIHAVAAGHAAGSANLGVQLFDFLFRPTPRVTEKVLAVAQHYVPRDQLVLTTHIRVGTPPSGAAYADPARDAADKAAAVAMKCANRAVAAATQFVGRKKQLLWFVATDNRDSTTNLRNLAPHVLGLEPVIVEVPATVPTVHVGQIYGVARDKVEEGFYIVYAEMFLLSVGHAMVRSRSGFSELAQGWGRIPYALKISAGESDECIDLSMQAFQTVGREGFRIGMSDSSLWEYPQIFYDPAMTT